MFDTLMSSYDRISDGSFAASEAPANNDVSYPYNPRLSKLSAPHNLFFKGDFRVSLLVFGPELLDLYP